MRWIDREEGGKQRTLALTVEGVVTLEMTAEEVASQTCQELRVVLLPLIGLPVLALCFPARRDRYSTAYLTFTPTSMHHPVLARASISVHD